jgi:uracil-DNA glycosylase
MIIKGLASEIISCRKCPRLVKWREKIARDKTKRFADYDYWGKPIPGIGDANAELLLIGLAPAAHDGNRTGRMFTGDRSGDWLFRALHKSGFANQPFSIDRDDGLKLINCYITAACRCAPPQNKLLPIEIKNCSHFQLEELRLLKNVRVVCGLGKVGFETALSSFEKLGWTSVKYKPKFGHGVEIQLNDKVRLIGSFHPSQQNTFTKRLTEPMFDDIFIRIRNILKKQ